VPEHFVVFMHPAFTVTRVFGWEPHHGVIEGSPTDAELLYGRICSAPADDGPDRCVQVGNTLVSVYWPYRNTPYTLASQMDRILEAVSRTHPPLPGMRETIPARQRFLVNEWYRYAAAQAADYVPEDGRWPFDAVRNRGQPLVRYGDTPPRRDTGRGRGRWKDSRFVVIAMEWTHDEGVTWTLRASITPPARELGKVVFDWYGGFMRDGYRYYSLDYSRGWNTLREAMDDFEKAQRPG
jgi:hypothetical protein